MPYAKDHLLVTFGGTQAGAEIWQCGLHFASEGSATLGWPVGGFNLESMFDSLKLAFTSSNISNGAALGWVKIALVGTDGKYKTDPMDYHGTPLSGIVATLVSGPQDSMCVSLWSGSSLGKGNHGRFYLPWNGTNVDRTTGKFVQSLLPPIVAAWVTCIHEIALQINTNMSSGGQPSDLTTYIMGPSGKAKPAVELRIGDVMDSQRRRRNALREVYTSSPL